MMWTLVFYFYMFQSYNVMLEKKEIKHRIIRLIKLISCKKLLESPAESARRGTALRSHVKKDYEKNRAKVHLKRHYHNTSVGAALIMYQQIS